MALRKQTIDLPIMGGINQKISDKNLQPPKLRSLINGRYRKQGRIDKRYGYTNLKLNVNTGTLNTPVSINTLKNELIMISNDRLYSYSSADSMWYERGEMATATTELETLITPVDSSYSNIDILAQDGILVVTWYDGTNNYYAIYDEATLTQIKGKTALASGNVQPRIASISNYMAILYHTNTNDLDYVLIPTSNPSNVSTDTLYSDADSNGYFEFSGSDTNFFLMYLTTTSNTCRIAKIDDEMVVVANNTFTGTPTNSNTMAMNVFTSESEGQLVVALGWHDSSNNVKTVMYDNSLVTYYAAANVEASIANVDTLTIAIDSTDGSSVGYYYGITAANSYNNYTKSCSVQTDGTVGTAGVFLRSVTPVSKACYYNDIGYFNVLHDSTLQATYFTVSTQGKVIAKYAAGEGPEDGDIGRLSNFGVSNTSTDFYFGALKKGRIKSENATIFANLGLGLATLCFDNKTRALSAQLNDNLIISGGVLRAYDGESAVEYGFNLYPENVTAVENGAGSVPNGTYLCYAVYEWYDAKGIRHQSAPSVGQSVTVSGGGSTAIDVTVPTLRITDKTSDTSLYSRDNVQVKVYITEASGTVPYYSGFKAENTDITTTDSVTVSLTSNLSSITSNEILYTSGGALENIAPVAANYSFIYDNRPVLVGLEDGDVVRFGKNVQTREGVGFNEDLEFRVDPLGGKLVAGAAMESYMVLFKETATYIVYGSGPNDLGANSNFSTPELISSDIGCQSPKSVLQTPKGIVFQSNKGIYMVTKDLRLQYIGANVEDYNSSTIVASNILKDSNEIRFVTDQGVTLVFNYFFNAWAIDTTPNAIDATIWQNTKYTYISTTKALQEDSTTFLDDGSYVSTTIKTGWINLSGLQGYQRLYEIGLLGSYHNNHIFQVKSYYNYSDIVKETQTITAATLVNTAVYGDSATYGADDVYGGSENDEVYQTRYRPSIQKCQSMSIELVDSIVGSNNGEGFSLEGLSLTVGRKKGLFKTSTTRST